MTQPAPPGMPPAEIAIDAALVRALLEEQHPDLAALAIRFVTEGWDNCLFRLGAGLIVRLPRRRIAAQLTANEQRWLPQLAPRLPLAIPAPVRVGRGSALFPWPWSIVAWLDGDTADEAPPAPEQARVLAGFLRTLHVRAPETAPTNRGRGVPLAARADTFQERCADLTAFGEPLAPALRQTWERALAAPIDVAGVWLHGDLHPRNVLVKDGCFSAVIDWGDICAGDPATDLAAIWMLFEPRAARQAALAAYAPSQATFDRARGWATLMGLMLQSFANNRPLMKVGAATLKRLAEGP